LSLQYTTSEVIHHCAIVAQNERNVFKNTIHGQRHGFVALAVLMLSTACADSTTLGPDLVGDAENRSGSVPTAGQLEGIVAGSSSNTGMRAPDLSACAILQIDQPSKIAFRVFATGVQIYSWNGASWTFVGPEADLFADDGAHGLVGKHFSGPTWESVNGGKVYRTVLQRCTPDAASSPWLLLAAVPDGPGIFLRVTHIQRVNTAGGNAPSYAGSAGEIARVPYTSDYVFYRAQ
jgi:hypothetical protein